MADDLDHADPDRVGPKGAIAAADAELQALLDAWVEKHRATFIEPNMFLGSRKTESFVAAAPLPTQPERGEG